MEQQETTLRSTRAKAGLQQRLARRFLFTVLNQLQHGELIICEDNEVVGQFGTHGTQPSARLDVRNPQVYRQLLVRGDIGAGESYVAGHWETPDLTAVIRVFAANLEIMDAIQRRFSWISWPLQKLSYLGRFNNRRRAKENIAAHYDLGNTLYQSFLDPRMQYSSAVYPSDRSTLAEAQEHKLARLCDMLDLQESDHLVEIGSGWGGLAIYAAGQYGCQVTTTTISKEQYQWACEQVQKAGLEDQVTVLLQDYRDLTGQYDKLVSVEMIEAVGARYLPTFFRQCQALLKPAGKMALQAITIADQRLEAYNRHVDFIQRHIFPGGYLVSVELLGRLFRRHTNLVVRQLNDIGRDYAQTLSDWRAAFNASFPVLAEQGYDEQFQRLWNYYLSYCEGGFRERRISTVQLLASGK